MAPQPTDVMASNQ
jgi:hypothetical protein